MKRYVKSILWGIAGLFVSLSIIKTGRITTFGWPLFVLSVLMFVLAAKQFFEGKKK